MTIRDEMREGFSKIFEKLDEIKDDSFKYQQVSDDKMSAVKERIVKLESQNSLFGKAIHYIFALAAGIFGGWIKNLHG